jgi:predicted nucleotidyltransferase
MKIGSYARGDFNLCSDVDLLIIVNFSGSPVQRLKLMHLHPGYEAIMLTTDEIIKMKNRNSRFTGDAFRDGIVIRRL